MPLEKLRNMFAVVDQKGHAFKGTVLSNIVLDRKDIDKEKLEELMKKLDISLTLKSKVEYFGENLSMGESQLISVLRALFSKKKIILMDEPTAYIDNMTANKVYEILKSLPEDVTVVMIPHKSDSISFFSKIVEIRKGKILREDINQAYVH